MKRLEPRAYLGRAYTYAQSVAAVDKDIPFFTAFALVSAFFLTTFFIVVPSVQVEEKVINPLVTLQGWEPASPPRPSTRSQQGHDDAWTSPAFLCYP